MTDMDYDRNRFLTDVFETLITLSGDPVTQIDHAVEETIDEHVQVLRKLARLHREEVVGMAEERRRTGKMVKTRWRL
jgi:hypothetical protein